MTPGIAVASRPRGNDWLADEMADLRSHEVAVLVSCLTHREEVELGLTAEREAALVEGLEFVAVPIPDMGVPESVRAFRPVATTLAAAERAGRRVAVHCRQGLGRSPLVVAAVLVANGSVPDEAWKLVGERRGVTVPETDEQRDWLARLVARSGDPQR